MNTQCIENPSAEQVEEIARAFALNGFRVAVWQNVNANESPWVIMLRQVGHPKRDRHVVVERVAVYAEDMDAGLVVLKRQPSQAIVDLDLGAVERRTTFQELVATDFAALGMKPSPAPTARAEECVVLSLYRPMTHHKFSHEHAGGA